MFNNKLRHKRLSRSRKINNNTKIIDELIIDLAIPIILEQNKSFKRICIISENPEIIYNNNFFKSYEICVLSHEKFINYQGEFFDALLGLTTLNFSNKVEDDLNKIKSILNPSSFFLCTYFSENNLLELKEIFKTIEIELFDGISQRFHPIVDIRDIGNLFNQYGFEISVIQRENILVQYTNFNELLLHLRKMAMTNILIDQNNYTIGKKFYSMIIDKFNKKIKNCGIAYEVLIATAWTKD